MVDTTTTVATPQPAVATAPVTVEVTFSRCDGPFTRKSDSALIMFLRTDKTAAFDVDNGTITTSGNDLCVPYTEEAMEQALNIIANFGHITYQKKV
jgi:hypothetical protein